MKIYVGTTNNAKLAAVKEVLSEFEVIGIKVDSKVSNQPKSDEETITGAYNRAKALPHGFRLGLEAGVHETLGEMYLTNFGVLIDEDDNVYYAGGTRLPLPHEVVEGIMAGYELADVMTQITKDKETRNRDGAIVYFTNEQVVRKDIFTHIVKLLYGQYLHRRNK